MPICWGFQLSGHTEQVGLQPRWRYLSLSADQPTNLLGLCNMFHFLQLISLPRRVATHADVVSL